MTEAPEERGPIRRASPDIDENRSVWMDDSHEGYQASPPLQGSERADVAVIGGGFTGVSTAYHLSRRFPDKRIVLLEARTLANGASGRNGGQMLNWLPGIEPKDPELARRIYSATKEGIDGIEAIIREHGLRVRYRRDGCLQVFTDARRAEEAHARAEELTAWGIPVRYVQGAELSTYLRPEGAVGAMLDSSEGQLHGVDFLRGMKPVLLAQGVKVFEGSPVLSIREGRSITLTTAGGDVRAQAIVLATNGYTPRLGYFRSGVFALHSHMLATEPLSREQAEALGWGRAAGFADDLDRISYGALLPSGELIFGGGSNASYGYLWGNRTSFPGTPESASRSFAAIQRQLNRYFPAAARLRIARRWTGTLGITMSRMCSMGVRGEHRNVYYALGYSGHGVTLANLAGRVLCDIYSGDDARWRELPFYQRKLGGIPPEPLRWIGYHVYTRLTGRSPRKSAETP
jgi:gamma-glutamylputrescine oxidase